MPGAVGEVGRGLAEHLDRALVVLGVRIAPRLLPTLTLTLVTSVGGGNVHLLEASVEGAGVVLILPGIS